MMRATAFENQSNRRLDERDTDFGIGSPYSTASASNSVEYDIETHGDAICRGKLQACARIRKVADSTIELWRFVTENDLRVLQHALAEGRSFFLHGRAPGIDRGLSGKRPVESQLAARAYILCKRRE